MLGPVWLRVLLAQREEQQDRRAVFGLGVFACPVWALPHLQGTRCHGLGEVLGHGWTLSS